MQQPQVIKNIINKKKLPLSSDMKHKSLHLSSSEQAFKSKLKGIMLSKIPKTIKREFGSQTINLNNSYNKSHKMSEDFLLHEKAEEKKTTTINLPNMIQIKRLESNDMKNIHTGEANDSKDMIKSKSGRSNSSSNVLLSHDSFISDNSDNLENEGITIVEKKKSSKFKSSKFREKEFASNDNDNNDINSYKKNLIKDKGIEEIICYSALSEEEDLSNKNSSSQLIEKKPHFRNVYFDVIAESDNRPGKDNENSKNYEKNEIVIVDSCKSSIEIFNKQKNDCENNKENFEEKKINLNQRENDIEIQVDWLKKARTQEENSNILSIGENEDLNYNKQKKLINDNNNKNKSEVQLNTEKINDSNDKINIIKNKNKKKNNHLSTIKDLSSVRSNININNNLSRSLSEVSNSNNDVMNEEEEKRINEKIKVFQNKIIFMKKQQRSSQILNNYNYNNSNNNADEASRVGFEHNANSPGGASNSYRNSQNFFLGGGPNNQFAGGATDEINTKNPEEEKEKHYLKDIQNKANLKLDKKLTQNFTNRVILIIMVLLVVLPIIDLDFIFDLLYSKDVQPNYKYFCMDLIYSTMNLSLYYPEKYLPLFNSTIESCFYGYGNLDNFTADRSLIKQFPKDLEFFMQLNFSNLDIFEQFNNSTNFFKKEYLELNYFKNYTKNLRLDVDYFDELYSYDENRTFSYITNKVLFSTINCILSILKSFFVAVVLVFGTFLFTKDISFYVISPLEKLFTKLEIIFNSVDNLCEEHMELESYFNSDNKNINLKNTDKQSENADSYNVSKTGQKKNNNNKKDENENENSKNLKRVHAEEELKVIKNENIDNKKSSKNNFNNENSDSFDSKHKMGDGDLLGLRSNSKKNKKIEIKKKTKKLTLEIDRVDFSIMKLLDLIAISLGNPLLMMVPNCDLDKDLVINLKSPGIQFNGFILMMSFSNKENLFRKIGKKANKYFNKVVTLFHSIGLIFCGQPYKINDMDFIIWRKDKNSYLRDIFNYIQSLSNIIFKF